MYIYAGGQSPQNAQAETQINVLYSHHYLLFSYTSVRQDLFISTNPTHWELLREGC